MQFNINNEFHQISLKNPHNILTNQTPIRNRIDTNSSSLREKKLHNNSLQMYDLQDVLTNQKIRWAKKGSMVVSYQEDPSYYAEHSEQKDNLFKTQEDSQIEDSQQQTGGSDTIFSKRQMLQTNNIKKALKQKYKAYDETPEDKLFNLLYIKLENEKNLQKVNQSPKYKLFQTSVQKRNLPPVKLNQLKYLQQFEQIKKDNPHLNRPLNELINQNTQEFNEQSQNDNSINNIEFNEIRKHVYKQVEIVNQNQSFIKNSEISNSLNNSLNFSLQNNSQQNIINEKSQPTTQGSVINTSPSRKLPRVFGLKKQSPDRYQDSVSPNIQRSQQFNNLHLQDLKIDDNEQFCNFYSNSVNHLHQGYQFSIKSTQITPQSNKKISPYVSERSTLKYNSSTEQNPYHINLNTKNSKNSLISKQLSQNTSSNLSFQFSKNIKNSKQKSSSQQIIFNPYDDINSIYTSN